MPDKPARVCIILNPAAFAFLHRPVRDICDQIATRFAAHGIAADIHLAFGGSLERHARAAVADRQTDAIIAGGGDGTFGRIAAALVDTGVPLGLLPLGRFDHFARDAGIPADIDQAIDIVADGNLVPVDTGEVNGRIFVNNSSIGIYPFLVLDREKRVRHRLLRPIAYLLAGIKVLRRFPLRRVSVRNAGRAEIWRTPCVFVGNNEYRLELFALGTRPSLTEGRLWVCIARQQSRLSVLWFTFRYLSGLIDPARDLKVFHTTSLEIGSRSRRVTVAMDGEVLRMQTPLRFRIRPASLRVYVPLRGYTGQ